MCITESTASESVLVAEKHNLFYVSSINLYFKWNFNYIDWFRDNVKKPISGLASRRRNEYFSFVKPYERLTTFELNIRTLLLFFEITVCLIDFFHSFPFRFCVPRQYLPYSNLYLLMDTHPYNAPLAYVKPTSDMQIKVSMYVDYNGKIYLPYLHDWNPVSVKLSLIHSKSMP